MYYRLAPTHLRRADAAPYGETGRALSGRTPSPSRGARPRVEHVQITTYHSTTPNCKLERRRPLCRLKRIKLCTSEVVVSSGWAGMFCAEGSMLPRLSRGQFCRTNSTSVAACKVPSLLAATPVCNSVETALRHLLSDTAREAHTVRENLLCGREGGVHWGSLFPLIPRVPSVVLTHGGSSSSNTADPCG